MQLGGVPVVLYEGPELLQAVELPRVRVSDSLLLRERVEVDSSSGLFLNWGTNDENMVAVTTKVDFHRKEHRVSSSNFSLVIEISPL